ncbi:SpoIID/LytB domain-containing protein [candidate division WWE3 bacterium]|uniref:SpoIID/LytB domain-containing protein n=1 Tax=candidate division WWE3 bacterium TaxID=2053526 RepID=A0A955RQR7_UNCKA|nr:SpoIID/LytB domain-containing protein [candidate division WWE3 bacterium]
MPKKKLLAVTAVFLLLLGTSVATRSNELDDLDKQLTNTQKLLEDAQNKRDATQSKLQQLQDLKAYYEGSLGGLQNSYYLTREQLDLTEQTLSEKETELNQVEAEIDATQNNIDTRYTNVSKLIRTMYINQTPGWFADVFAASHIQTLITELIYRNAVIQGIQTDIANLKEELVTIAEIKDLLNQVRTELENEKANLLAQQRTLQNEISSTKQQISSTSSQASQLSQSLVGINQQISSLTEKQQQILAAKAAAALASTTVGDEEIDKAAIEQSAPNDGQVYFSFWTYGYPHRVGMSQYGALGRAMAGQTYKQILSAYYSIPVSSIVDWDNTIIHVYGCSVGLPPQAGGWSKEECELDRNGDNKPDYIFYDVSRTLENYILHLGEMPEIWGERGGMEALKAQAVAGRTYALAYTNNGNSPICPSTHCQVFGNAKTGNWGTAVEQTSNKVIVLNGSPINAYYHSTAGGFTLSSQEVWGGYRSYAIGIADFDANGKAYEGPTYADSPWYHKSWGNAPWLSIDQIVDLFNAALLPDAYNNHLALYENGGYSAQQIVDELTSLGVEPVTDFDAIEIVDENGGSGANTAQVGKVRMYYQNGKVAEVTGSRFKFVFNLRSPGTDAIWTTRFDVITAAEL